MKHRAINTEYLETIKSKELLTTSDLVKLFNYKSNHTIYYNLEKGYLHPPKVKTEKIMMWETQTILEFIKNGR